MSAASPVLRTGQDGTLVRVRAWDLVVRITHWVIALSIVVLSVTGIYIGHPFVSVSGPAGQHFVMGWMKVVHFYAAIAFILAVLSRIVWMFVGKGHARWRELVPIARQRRRDFLATIAFYSFLRRRPPTSIGHNPVAGAAYSAVYGLYLVMTATGLGLYAQDAGPASSLHGFQGLLGLFGGAQWARFVHHGVMWLLLGFVVHHLYSAILTAVVERNGTMDSIFTGNKWVTPEEAEADGPAREAR
jgi:Ni/Fe-hydrogenase 1 B-type cytochrome subunit